MIKSNSRFRTLALAVLSAVFAGCATNPASTLPGAEGPTFTVPAAALSQPLKFVAYGDMRFTDPTRTDASSPTVRRALIARIAEEQPSGVFISGDIPWRGGVVADYAVFRTETEVWRERGLRIYPVLGNHEFYGASEAQCLENWWNTFPELRDHRWYSVALGTSLRAIALDSDAPLVAGSPQRAWLEAELKGLPRSVKFVLVSLHHPPVADPATGSLASHNPRPNEVALAEYLNAIAPKVHERFVVVAGHTHNYERFEVEGVTYVVSGGGGAHPYEVERGPLDLYHGKDFPNFHYLRFTLSGDRLSAEMVRVGDPDAAVPHVFEVRDRFEVRARP
ncbi:MAG TPA: metallophosphoesterase [Steroidobacteraceae bacterium]|nr:metallophosphoesterase [Steroidobacteraceae bacterium]